MEISEERKGRKEKEEKKKKEELPSHSRADERFHSPVNSGSPDPGTYYVVSV
jgi:hypothetical protein